MPRFLLALIATLTALTFTLALTARAWGEARPPHPALRGFVEGCEAVPQPCWYGITPQQSNLVLLDVADSSLSQHGYTLVGEGVTLDERQYPYRQYRQLDVVSTCDTSLTYLPTSTEVIYIGLNCTGIQVGDLLRLWGMPDYVRSEEYPFIFYAEPYVWVNVSSAQNLLAPLSSIQLPASYGIPTFRWHGLLPTWRYCQIEPAICNREPEG